MKLEDELRLDDRQPHDRLARTGRSTSRAATGDMTIVATDSETLVTTDVVGAPIAMTIVTDDPDHDHG